MRLIHILGAALLAACSGGKDDIGSNNAMILAGEEEPIANAAPAGPAAPPQPAKSVAPGNDLVSEAPFTADSAQGAATVVQTYYALIEAKKYAEALRLWGPGSDLADATFAARFGGYRDYHAEVGAPGPVTGAGEARSVEVPIRAYGVTTRGERFEVPGVVTLRPLPAGAGPRRWHIARVDLPPH